MCPHFTKSSSLKPLKRVIFWTNDFNKLGRNVTPPGGRNKQPGGWSSPSRVSPAAATPIRASASCFSTTDPGNAPGRVCSRVAGWSRDSQWVKHSCRVTLQQCSQLRHRGVTSGDPGNSFHATRRKTRTSQKLINKLNNLEFRTRLKLILFSLFLFIDYFNSSFENEGLPITNML